MDLHELLQTPLAGALGAGLVAIVTWCLQEWKNGRIRIADRKNADRLRLESQCREDSIRAQSHEREDQRRYDREKMDAYVAYISAVRRVIQIDTPSVELRSAAWEGEAGALIDRMSHEYTLLQFYASREVQNSAVILESRLRACLRDRVARRNDPDEDIELWSLLYLFTDIARKDVGLPDRSPSGDNERLQRDLARVLKD